MARRPTTQPTEVELEILQVLWEHGPCPLGRIHRGVAESCGRAYSTTRKMIQVMREKGLVTCDESVRPQLYEAADTVETAGASSVFFIADMTNHPEQKILDITGTRQMFVQDQKTDEKQLVYRLAYQIRDGRFWINDFAEREN